MTNWMMTSLNSGSLHSFSCALQADEMDGPEQRNVLPLFLVSNYIRFYDFYYLFMFPDKWKLSDVHICLEILKFEYSSMNCFIRVTRCGSKYSTECNSV